MHVLRQIYIKDVKSSNGTFINGERLSPEGAESDPFELKTDDIVVSAYYSISFLRLQCNCGGGYMRTSCGVIAAPPTKCGVRLATPQHVGFIMSEPSSCSPHTERFSTASGERATGLRERLMHCSRLREILDPFESNGCGCSRQQR